jgi:hypothetical protein
MSGLAIVHGASACSAQNKTSNSTQPIHQVPSQVRLSKEGAKRFGVRQLAAALFQASLLAVRRRL